MAAEESAGWATETTSDISVGKYLRDVGIGGSEWADQLEANVVVGMQTLGGNFVPAGV
jgi:hypothetical protein